MLGVLVLAVTSSIFANRLLNGIHWVFLSAFFALTARIKSRPCERQQKINADSSVELRLAYGRGILEVGEKTHLR
jgi:hypothetical protein